MSYSSGAWYSSKCAKFYESVLNTWYINVWNTYGLHDHTSINKFHLYLFQMFQVVSYLVSQYQHISNKTDIFQPCSVITFCSDYLQHFQLISMFFNIGCYFNIFEYRYLNSFQFIHISILIISTLFKFWNLFQCISIG